MMGRYPHLGAFEIEGPADLVIVEQALEATGTLGLKDRQFATLSGGEKQRVIVAAALAQLRTSTSDAAPSTGILLLDEPTAVARPRLSARNRRPPSDASRPPGRVDRALTHDLNLASGLCRTLVLMRERHGDRGRRNR